MKRKSLLVLMVVGLLAALITVSTTQLAQAAPDLDWIDWTVMYEANELPDVADPAWEGVGNMDGVVSVSSGILTIIGRYAWRHQNTLSVNSVGNIIELSVIPIAPDPPNIAYPLTIFIEDGTVTTSLHFYKDRINYRPETGITEDYYFNTSDAFHIYKIEIKGSVCNVSIDGILHISYTPYTQAGTSNITFGTSSGLATCQIDYIRYYTGVVTPIGTNVTVNLPAGVSMTYDNVTQEGYTNVTISETGPEPPEGFNLKPTEPKRYYDITTTATYSGNVIVSIIYEDAWIEPGEAEDDLKLMHYEAPDWVKVTDPGYPDTVNNVIQGTVSTFSPFVLAMPISVPATLRIKPETLNLKSQGDFVAIIESIEGYSLKDVDLDSIECEGAKSVAARIAHDKLVVNFDRKDLVNVPVGKEVELTVTGRLKDGRTFKGSDTIRVIDKGKK